MGCLTVGVAPPNRPRASTWESVTSCRYSSASSTLGWTTGRSTCRRLPLPLLIFNKNCAQFASRSEQRAHWELSSIRKRGRARGARRGTAPTCIVPRATSFSENPPSGGEEDDRAPFDKTGYTGDGRRGRVEGGDRPQARRVAQHRGQVRRRGGRVARRAGARGEAAPRHRRARRADRLGARGGPRGAAQAAPRRQGGLRQVGRRARLRRVVLERPPLRRRLAAGPRGGVRERRLPGARLGAGHRAGRLRQLQVRGRREGPGRQAPRRRAAALQRPLLHGDAVAALRAPVRRAARGARVDREGAFRARAGQRDRSRQDGPRRGDGVPAVLPVQDALQVREQVLQPLLRQREGLGRERGRVPAAQPPGARAPRLDDGRAQRRPSRRLRQD